MKHSLLTLLFLTGFVPIVYSQVDYLEFKDQYNLSCHIPDSSVIVRNQHLVDSLHTLKIIRGEKEFLYDHGWVYYVRYLKWKDLQDLEKAALSFEKGWTEHQDLAALWGLGGISRTLGNCEKALDLTDLYIDEIPDTVKVDYRQVYTRYKYCRIEK